MERHTLIEEARVENNLAQEKQAERMLKMGKKQANNFKIGDLVLYSVADVDRGPLDANNLLCYILEDKHNLFKIACKAGVLDRWIGYNCLTKCDLQYTEFTINNIPYIKDSKGIYLN